VSVRERADILWQKHDDCSDDWCATEGHNVCEVIWPVAELREALNRTEAASKLHREITEGIDSGFCEQCEFAWPCPTWLALNPKEADE
jgi:hypothetical protein